MQFVECPIEERNSFSSIPRFCRHRTRILKNQILLALTNYMCMSSSRTFKTDEKLKISLYSTGINGERTGSALDRQQFGARVGCGEEGLHGKCVGIYNIKAVGAPQQYANRAKVERRDILRQRKFLQCWVNPKLFTMHTRNAYLPLSERTVVPIAQDFEESTGDVEEPYFRNGNHTLLVPHARLEESDI